MTPTLRAIVEDACAGSLFTPADIVGRDRDPGLTPLRARVAHRLIEEGLSPRRIGALLGGRERTTVLYWLGKAKAPEGPKLRVLQGAERRA